MHILLSQSTRPAFNIASEEYFLTQHDSDIIVLYRNAPSVIIGKNQNAIQEIDLGFVKQNNIDVVRRLSGGGAVFHDLGNINFSVISNIKTEDFNNYKKFTDPVCSFLKTLGVDAYLQGRNDLLIDGKKFSGNAQAVRGQRIMHHGTLMYNADIEKLKNALKPNPAKIKSKGIESVRSRVTNIAQHMPSPISPTEFVQRLYDFYVAQGGLSAYTLTEHDTRAINKLVESKFATWDWNIGKSPDYEYTHSEYFAFGLVEVSLSTQKSVIEEISITGDFFGEEDIADIEKMLIGTAHERKAVEQAISKMNLGKYISGISPRQFVALF